MKYLTWPFFKPIVWNDARGQDLIEYALLAGFAVLAAGALIPGIATSISTIISKLAWPNGGGVPQS
jgi:Flp pilus assembly pilin Flp